MRFLADAGISRRRSRPWLHRSSSNARCAAERRYLGKQADERALHESAASDRRFVLAVLDRLARWDDHQLRELELRTDRLLVKHWDAVKCVVACLLDRKTLTGDEVDECIARLPAAGTSVKGGLRA